MSAFAVVPVKTLVKSKTRLSDFFTLEERALFTLTMLKDVLNALKASILDQTLVVGSDTAVKDLTENFGMIFLEEKHEGLNLALEQGTRWCIRNRAKRVLVLPADVPLVTSKDIDQILRMTHGKSVVISPSRNGGTNALLKTPPGIIPSCFGPDSFKKHVIQARMNHVQTKIYVSANLILDIDSEADLRQMLKVGDQTATHRFLTQAERIQTLSTKG